MRKELQNPVYLFSDTEFIKNLSVEQPNVFQKVYEEIKYLCKVATAGSKEAKELEKVKKTFAEVYRQKNNTATDDGVKYALNQKITEKDISKNITTVLKLESVSNLTGNEFAKSEKDLTTQVDEFFNSINNVIETKYGDIKLTKRGIKSSIGHGVGRNKAIAFKAIPEVINKGEIIDYQENWKNRGYDTVVFAAPIEIKNTPYYMAVIVKVETTENSYYLHEVVLQKNEGNTSFKTGTVKDGTSGDVSPSIYTLLQKLKDVKNNSNRDSTGRELSTEQIKFFENSKVRDTEGCLIPVFHGTPDARNTDNYGRKEDGTEFTIFDYERSFADHIDGSGYYFTTNKNLAEFYAPKDMEHKKIYETYLNLVNPYIVNADGAEWSKISDDEIYASKMFTYEKFNYEVGYYKTFTTKQIAKYAKKNG